MRMRMFFSGSELRNSRVSPFPALSFLLGFRPQQNYYDTDLAFKVWTGLRDMARAPDEIATREIRGSA